MSSTFEERKETLQRVTRDTLLDPIDQLKFIYHWMGNEFALLKIEKGERRNRKHSKALRVYCHIFNAKHELNDL